MTIRSLALRCCFSLTLVLTTAGQKIPTVSDRFGTSLANQTTITYSSVSAYNILPVPTSGIQVIGPIPQDPCTKTLLFRNGGPEVKEYAVINKQIMLMYPVVNAGDIFTIVCFR